MRNIKTLKVSNFATSPPRIITDMSYILRAEKTIFPIYGVIPRQQENKIYPAQPYRTPINLSRNTAYNNNTYKNKTDSIKHRLFNYHNYRNYTTLSSAGDSGDSACI